MSLVLVITIVVVALIFDFLNGFHDAANSIATVVATKVLTPFRAVIWAAFFNLVAPLVFGVAVANTIAKTIHTDPFTHETTLMIVMAGLCGAIFWNLITWFFGLPTSSSHALIGGLAGAAICAAKFLHIPALSVLELKNIDKTAIFIVLAPLIGMIIGYMVMIAVMWIFRRSPPRRVDSLFRRLQLVSAAAYSFGHGTNDAQKTMGVIGMVLVASGHLASSAGKDIPVPWEVKLLCAGAIALGTMTGGWRIVKTMGLGITKLKPVGGFCAETAGALTIMGVTLFGIPVSTTHTITGAIVGVGATHRLSAVRWGVAGRIVWAWVLTMPLAALMASAVYALIHFFTR